MKFPDGVDKDSEAYKKFESKVIERLKQTTSAMFSSSRVWDDGIILPQNTRQVEFIYCTYHSCVIQYL